MIKPLLDKQVFQATAAGKYKTTQGSALSSGCLANVGLVYIAEATLDFPRMHQQKKKAVIPKEMFASLSGNHIDIFRVD